MSTISVMANTKKKGRVHKGSSLHIEPDMSESMPEMLRAYGWIRHSGTAAMLLLMSASPSAMKECIKYARRMREAKSGEKNPNWYLHPDTMRELFEEKITADEAMARDITRDPRDPSQYR